MAAEFSQTSSGVSPHRMALTTVGEAFEQQYIAPPWTLEWVAEFPEKVLLVIVGEQSSKHIPPPALAELPEKRLLLIVGEEWAHRIPPPGPPAELPEKRLLLIVGEE